MERVTVEAAVDRWVREVAVDPKLAVPNTAGGFEIGGYFPFLFGHLPPGAAKPTSGRLSHLLELRFMLTADETPETINPIIERLRAAASADPELDGRLDDGARLSVGDVKVAGLGERNPRGGPVVIVGITVAEHV
jgi:hypothetical protein